VAQRRAAAALLLAAAATAASAARAEEPRRLHFAPPDGYKLAATRHDGADLPGGGEQVYELTPPDGARITVARVLVGLKKISDRDLESASAERHGAFVKNRAAWGMQMSGGVPREELQLGGRRALRYRDRVGGALGSTEQSFTCEVVAGLLACAFVTAPADARDRADALAAALLASVSVKRR
jgi:hypothetical protein